MSFRIFQYEETSFQVIKSRSSKNRKIEIFLKGLTYGFGPKMAIFTTFKFLQVIQARKKSFKIFQNKKTPFQSIKTRSLKYRKIDIFPKGLTHGFRPKMAIFPTFFFKGIKGQENFFYDIQEGKNFSLGYKNKMFKKSKN